MARQRKRTLTDFQALQASTAGMLAPEVYQAFYEAALGSDGDVIDIGVGRGGTSVAYAWGIVDAGRSGTVHAIDQFFQHSSAKPHRFTRKSHPEDCVALNVAEYHRNVDAAGVGERVVVWPGTTDEVAPTFPRAIRAGVLSIDVDGHIDRDLGYFYDHVEPGGLIVIDDCANKVTSQGIESIHYMRGASEATIRDWIGRLGSWKTRRLLGKHLLTYLLASEFERSGALRYEHKVGNTAFFRKAQAALLADLDLSGIAAVERTVVERYIGACLAE